MLSTWCSGSWMTMSQIERQKNTWASLIILVLCYPPDVPGPEWPWASLKLQQNAWDSLIILVLWYPPDVPGPEWPWASLKLQQSACYSLIILVLWYPPDVLDPEWPYRRAVAQSQEPVLNDSTKRGASLIFLVLWFTWCSGSWMTMSHSRDTKPGANLKRQHKAWDSLLILVLWIPPDVPGPEWPCHRAAAQSQEPI